MSDLGNKEIMAQNIEKFMALHNETRKDLATILGTPYTTVTNWIKAETYPRIDKIEMMAAHWGVKKSDLVEHKLPLTDTSEGKSQEFIQLWGMLTSEEQKVVIAQIKGILSNRE